MQKEILNRLEAVDWASLKALDVAEWLKNLTSQDQEVRTNAFSKLERRLAFQGSDDWSYGPLSELLKTEMPVFVVPFLIDLLRDQEVKSKDGILELLQDLATYVKLPENMEIYRTRAQRVYDAVKQGIDVYKSLLSNTSPAVKMGATLLLEELDEKI